MARDPNLPSAGVNRVRFSGFASAHLSHDRHPEVRPYVRPVRAGFKPKSLEAGPPLP